MSASTAPRHGPRRVIHVCVVPNSNDRVYNLREKSRRVYDRLGQAQERTLVQGHPRARHRGNVKHVREQINPANTKSPHRKCGVLKEFLVAVRVVMSRHKADILQNDEIT